MAQHGVVLAAIPYTTFPTIDLGFVSLRTFGLVVAVRGPRRGVARRPLRRGVPASRATSPTAWPCAWSSPASSARASPGWSPTSTTSTRRSTPSPSGRAGCSSPAASSFAVIAGYPIYHHWNRLTRWHSLDGYAYGLAIGLGIGRIGCYAVGEHFGGQTSFPLAVRFDGGSVREPFLGTTTLEPGMVFHQTALYELIYMVVLFLLLTYVLYGRKQRPGPGTAVAIFCAYYGVARFASDLLRVNDETGARAHRRAVPLPRHAAGAAPGSGSGSASSWRATSRPGMPVGVDPAEPENRGSRRYLEVSALRDHACAVRRVAVRSAGWPKAKEGERRRRTAALLVAAAPPGVPAPVGGRHDLAARRLGRAPRPHRPRARAHRFAGLGRGRHRGLPRRLRRHRPGAGHVRGPLRADHRDARGGRRSGRAVPGHAARRPRRACCSCSPSSRVSPRLRSRRPGPPRCPTWSRRTATGTRSRSPACRCSSRWCWATPSVASSSRSWIPRRPWPSTPAASSCPPLLLLGLRNSAAARPASVRSTVVRSLGDGAAIAVRRPDGAPCPRLRLGDRCTRHGGRGARGALRGPHRSARRPTSACSPRRSPSARWWRPRSSRAAGATTTRSCARPPGAGRSPPPSRPRCSGSRRAAPSPSSPSPSRAACSRCRSPPTP